MIFQAKKLDKAVQASVNSLSSLKLASHNAAEIKNLWLTRDHESKHRDIQQTLDE